MCLFGMSWASHCIAAESDYLEIFEVSTFMVLQAKGRAYVTWIRLQVVFLRDLSCITYRLSSVKILDLNNICICKTKICLYLPDSPTES